MLESAHAVAFVPSENLERSEQFFTGVLGLMPVSRSPFALVFECGGATLRVTKVDGLRPQPFTVFGWLVSDIESTVNVFRDSGALFVRYDGFDQDDHDVWTTPNGDKVAWFHDPDGNVLSLTQLRENDDSPNRVLP